jgi:hypothetical protein
MMTWLVNKFSSYWKIDFAEAHSRRFHEYFANSSEVNEEAHRREAKITEQVHKLASRMGLPEPDKVGCYRRQRAPFGPNAAESFASSSVYCRRLYYNYFFLIEPEDLPAVLRPLHWNDPRLNEDDYLNAVVAWVKLFLGITHPISIGLNERLFIQSMLQAMSNDEKYKKFREFVLTHELGHILLEHGLEDEALLAKGELSRKAISVVCGAGAAAILSASSFSIAPTALVGIGVYKITQLGLRHLKSCAIDRTQEYEADLLAKRCVGGEGGLYGQALKRSMFLRQDSICRRFCIDREGSERFSWLLHHPSIAEACQYLSYTQTG